MTRNNTLYETIIFNVPFGRTERRERTYKIDIEKIIKNKYNNDELIKTIKNNNNFEDQCPVCFSSIDDLKKQNNNYFIELKCQHYYCNSCINKWFKETLLSYL